MKWLMILLFVHQALSFAITPSPVVREEILATTTTPLTPTSIESASQTSVATSVTFVAPQIPLSALVTIAPLPVNPLERRQKCFDDRGFSVDCATWTGYYYTWGPSGDPYAGGPGEGGGGSGNDGGGDVVVYNNESDLKLVNLPAVLGLLCLTVLLFI